MTLRQWPCCRLRWLTYKAPSCYAFCLLYRGQSWRGTHFLVMLGTLKEHGGKSWLYSWYMTKERGMIGQIVLLSEVKVPQVNGESLHCAARFTLPEVGIPVCHCAVNGWASRAIFLAKGNNSHHEVSHCRHPQKENQATERHDIVSFKGENTQFMWMMSDNRILHTRTKTEH